MEPTFRLANDGDNAVHLEVEPTNAAGLSLYRKFGFEDHDRRLMTRWIGNRLQ